MNNHRPILLLAILALATTAPLSNARAQQLSESQLARLLKRFPAADANGDGKLTRNIGQPWILYSSTDSNRLLASMQDDAQHQIECG